MSLPTTQQPVLDSGDRLSRHDFHRRYCARPDIRRAELVEGVVHVPSPTLFSWHDDQAPMMVAWLKTYAARQPGVRSGGSATILLDETSEVQPDAFLFLSTPAGTGARVDEEGYLERAPQLVAEVAASTASYDLHDKKRAYLRSGVREYLVWRVLDGAFDWFRLRDGDYVRIEPHADGIIESEVFSGLRLHVARPLAGDMAGVLEALEA